MNEKQMEHNYECITYVTASIKRVTPAHTNSKALNDLNRQYSTPVRLLGN